MAEHQDAIARIKALCLELRLALEDLDDRPVPPPTNVVSLKPEGVELRGIIGRPEFKVVKGKSLWTAGLGIQDGQSTYWRSLTAWGSLADAAKSLQRGERVRLFAVPKDEQYVDGNGVLCRKTSYTVTWFDMEATASSATNRSPQATA